MAPNDSWDSLPWFDLEQDLFRLQKRIYQASTRGEKPRSGVDDNHRTTEEPDAVKAARPVLKPSGGSDAFA
jgi:hypothetical protein